MVLSKHILIEEDLKEYLDKNKKVEREPYNSVLKRLLKFKGEKNVK